MRIAGLGLATVLAFSTSSFAQHSSGSSGGHSSSSSSHNSSSSHSSSHASSSTSANHAATTTKNTSSSAPSAAVAKSDPKEAAPDQPVSKTASSETAGAPGATKRELPSVPKKDLEKTAPKEKTDLTRPVLCGGKPCNSPQHHHIWSLLRHRNPICPPGQTASKHGCSSGTQTTAVTHTCPVGQTWGGAACIASATRCPAGEIYIAGRCQADCGAITSEANNLTVQVRSSRQERDRLCQQDPGSMECEQARAHYGLAVQDYEMLLSRAPAQCRASLPDPNSL